MTCGRNIAPYWLRERSYSSGSVNTVLAAGNVTRAIPWTSAAALTTLISVRVAIASGGLAEPLREVLADTDGVGHRRQRRVHRADAREEAGVDDVQVVELVRLAVDVEDRGLRVRAEPTRPSLVGDAGGGDVHVHVEVLVEHVMVGHSDVV